MKSRFGYVSNSSSSSFLVAEDLTGSGIHCCHLDPLTVRKIGMRLANEYFMLYGLKNLESHNLERLKNLVWLMRNAGRIYATQLIDNVYEIYVGKGDGRRAVKGIKYLYGDDNHPYVEKSHKILDKGVDSVWILDEDCPRMEHDVPIVEVCERINDICGDSVVFEPDGNMVRIWKRKYEPGGEFDGF